MHYLSAAPRPDAEMVTTLVPRRPLGTGCLWFGTPFIPAGTGVLHVADIEPPAVLERARGELADVLDNAERETPDR